MSALQLQGQNYTWAVSFTGLNRELVCDTSNWDLYLHDGATEGGHRFLNMANADERYQARSVELDGLLEFEPQDKGILVRLGPSNYVLRTLTGTSGEITVTNGNGFSGQPTVSLPDTITPDLTFSGTVTFSEAIQGNLTGNVVGNVTGNIVGNVTGNVTGNLTGNANGNHTGTFTGDVDVSGGSITFADGQIPLAALAAEITDYILSAGIPSGCIVKWSGAIVDIPDGWFLCDGLNGTPDLRNSFVVGAGDGYAVGDTGGTVDHEHTGPTDSGGDHSHVVTVDGHSLTEAELPTHYHLMSKFGVSNSTLTSANYLSQERTAGGDTEYILNGAAGTPDVGRTGSVGSGAAHTHTGSGDSAGAHTHTFTSSTVDNLPPYYALAFIMKG